METANQGNKRICIIAASINMGGMQRAATNLCNLLVVCGFEVTLITLFKHIHFFRLNEKVKLLEPEQEVNTLNKASRLFGILKHIRISIKLADPNVIVSFGRYYSALTLFALRGRKIPIYISDRASSEYRDSIDVHLITMLIFRFIKPSGVIAQTKNSAEYQRKLFGERTNIRVIPNALRNVQLYPDITRQKQILAVGRMGDHLKGFDRLIEAFANIKNTEWQLVIAGGDTDGDYLKKQAAQLGILYRIKFLGRVKNIDKIYAQAGIFVIPSRCEGFPNALCEAMAAGLSCISFDFVAGPRDIITDGHDGLIVDNNNIPALTNAMDSLIENETERVRLGTNAMQIRERLKQEKIGQEYINFIFNYG